MVRRSSKSKVFGTRILTVSAVIFYLALPASVQAEDPPGQSYSPPPQATEKAYNPPNQESYNSQPDQHYDLGWLGLIGLAGLTGLARRR